MPLPAAGQAHSPAIALAANSGEVIGAASVCGVPEARLVALGRKVIGFIRDLATSAEELRAAQAAHESAVQRSAAVASRNKAEACGSAFNRFEELERRAE